MSAVEFDTAPQAAAAWWAVQIGAPMLMLGESSKHPVTAEQGSAFATALQAKLEAELDRIEALGLKSVSLGVDYGPEPILDDAAEEVGVSRSRFPWKTHMHVHRDHVIASSGYRGAWTLVWSAPDWIRPACGQHKYTDDWEPLNLVCSQPMYHDGECGQWVADPERCEVCQGTYVDHFGSNGGRLRDYTHSWKPGGAA